MVLQYLHRFEGANSILCNIILVGKTLCNIFHDNSLSLITFMLNTVPQWALLMVTPNFRLHRPTQRGGPTALDKHPYIVLRLSFSTGMPLKLKDKHICDILKVKTCLIAL